MKESKLIENRIWKYRKIKGLKQEDLAFLLGQENASHISRYERGLVIPKLEKLIKLSYGLNTDIESLYPELVGKWQEDVEKKKLQSVNK